MSPRKSTDAERRPRGGISLVGAIGGYVAACILGGLAVGFILDRLIGTSPLFLITGVVLGFILSFYFVYRLAMGELGD